MKIALIACGKTKTPHAAPAKDLYQGTLFKKSYAYALAEGFDEIYILSAKHGLVHPDTELEPYEETLVGKPKRHREMWALQVQNKLPKGDITYLAGTVYREFLPTGDCPMFGLSIGRQLQWLKKQGF